jgi:F0F1-type ATP synthase membrane subunit b/b'
MLTEARKKAEKEAQKILEQADKETELLKSSATSKMDQARDTIIKQLIG